MQAGATVPVAFNTSFVDSKLIILASAILIRDDSLRNNSFIVPTHADFICFVLSD